MVQTQPKSSTSNVQKQYRKAISINKKEINAWRKIFSMFGYKAECSRTIHVPTDTITRILKNEKGLQHIVVAIRQYITNVNR